VISSRTAVPNFLDMRQEIKVNPWGWKREDVTTLLLANSMVGLEHGRTHN